MPIIAPMFIPYSAKNSLHFNLKYPGKRLKINLYLKCGF